MATPPIDDAAVEAPPGEKRMSLGEHLREARRRIMICAAAILIAAVIGFIFSGLVLDVLSRPIELVRENRGDTDPGSTGLMIQTVTGAFDLRMKVAFSIAIFLAAPVWLWQIWAYIMPAMTKKEKRYTLGFTLAAVPLFFLGCYVGFSVAPHVVEIMASFLPEGVNALYDYAYYYDFMFKLLLAVGVAFVIPVFLVALNLTGIMSGRDILKGWRVAILIATIFAAVTTPGADVTSMLLLAGILIVLYFLAALVCLLFDRRKRKRMDAFMAAESPA
ncbi:MULTISPECIES: twin-arginine translocase subunit TatC [Microbacterium]|uniref:twin-arginine translocase subunit TatC n=1 Tax=Microbacterium TaxID=33882 RepID=UPI001E37F2F5|nr:twin-arginine translocase subunit TatC [Microbacterium nymphoidis]MCD2497356.1 twin-arginine translocase subunit TatC [Microbacterium nymphoidis]